uniref:Uncharacterized protein n=1 Tax=Sphaerodactylus townsendi TaxID=933632 RepID=A0ACB8GF46_9SAUR
MTWTLPAIATLADPIPHGSLNGSPHVHIGFRTSCFSRFLKLGGIFGLLQLQGPQLLHFPEQFLFGLLCCLQKFAFLLLPIHLKLTIQRFPFSVKLFSQLKPLMNTIISQGFTGFLLFMLGPFQCCVLRMKGERVWIITGSQPSWVICIFMVR